MLKKIKILTVVLIVFYLVPFLNIVIGKANIENMMFVMLASKINEKSKDEIDIIKNSFKFISTKINKPKSGKTLTRNSPFEILITKQGYCDEQADVLKTLLQFSGIESEIVFLKGKNKISKHSVLIVTHKNLNLILDPFYKELIYNKKNKIASFNDLRSGNVILNEKLPENYLDHYQGKYNYKIFKIKDASIFEISKKFYYKIWYYIFGYPNFKLYLKLGDFIGVFSNTTLFQINEIITE